jgi:hypothetical protein
MRTKAKVKKRSDGKIDGRTKEGRALRAKALAGGKKRKVESADEVRVKRKYTRRTESLGKERTRESLERTSKSVETKPYTQEELDQASSFFNNARSEVKNQVSQALRSTPREDWNKKTIISVNGNVKSLSTAAVAAALGIA